MHLIYRLGRSQIYRGHVVLNPDDTVILGPSLTSSVTLSAAVQPPWPTREDTDLYDA